MHVLLAVLRVVAVAAATVLILTISYTTLSLLFLSIPYRAIRAELPNGAFLNRAHPFSDEIVLRAPDGRIVVRDIVHVLFNDRYVAGQFYVARHSTARFIYRVGDDKAVRDVAGVDDPFDVILAASGLGENWPWGREDPSWLDFRRLLVRLGYRSPFPE